MLGTVGCRQCGQAVDGTYSNFTVSPHEAGYLPGLPQDGLDPTRMGAGGRVAHWYCGAMIDMLFRYRLCSPQFSVHGMVKALREHISFRGGEPDKDLVGIGTMEEHLESVIMHYGLVRLHLDDLQQFGVQTQGNLGMESCLICAQHQAPFLDTSSDKAHPSIHHHLLPFPVHRAASPILGPFPRIQRTVGSKLQFEANMLIDIQVDWNIQGYACRQTSTCCSGKPLPFSAVARQETCTSDLLADGCRNSGDVPIWGSASMAVAFCGSTKRFRAFACLDPWTHEDLLSLHLPCAVLALA